MEVAIAGSNDYPQAQGNKEGVGITVMHCLTTGHIPGNAPLGDFIFVNITEYMHTNLDSLLYTQATWYMQPIALQPLALGCKPIQHVTVLNTIGNCNTMVHICVSKHTQTHKIHSKHIKDK